jgi:hypothetical protein
MASLAADILGTYATEQIEILDRLVVCAMGAVYIGNQYSLSIYLKTLRNYCRWNTPFFVRKMGTIRRVTRGLRRRWNELFFIARSEDVISRCESTLIKLLANFSHHNEICLDGNTIGDVVHAFEIVIRYAILTWKYVELCLPINVASDDSIIPLEDVSEDGLMQYYEYRFMNGML